jgi:hypothetical protein
VSSIALFLSESICALSYESARPQLAQHLYFAAAPGLSGGCPPSLDPEGSEVWIGCGRHGVIFSSLPQCKHAGHSVALGSAYRILRPLWQCDRFKNIGVSPCLSVCSFLVRSDHGHQRAKMSRPTSRSLVAPLQLTRGGLLANIAPSVVNWTNCSFRAVHLLRRPWLSQNLVTRNYAFTPTTWTQSSGKCASSRPKTAIIIWGAHQTWPICSVPSSAATRVS